MIPVFSIPKITRKLGLNLEQLRSVNRSLGLTVKSPKPWRMPGHGFKDEIVCQWFETLADKIHRTSFPKWKPKRIYTTRVALEYYKGTKWIIEYESGDQTLQFTLFRPEGKTPLRDLPTSEYWNDYDAWVVDQPSSVFDFRVEIKKPTLSDFAGVSGVESKRIGDIRFTGYPVQQCIVDKVDKIVKQKRSMHK